MDWDDFAPWGKRVAEWTAEYHKTIRDRPVRAQVRPGETLDALPLAPPDDAEALDDIFADFERIVMPGITHWQHPRFFAYFNSNAAPASVLAEWLAMGVAAQCMLWQTSPSATEMETRMMDWLRQGIGLPEGFHGVIQDSASSATLAAVLVMRERALDWSGNKRGLPGARRLRIYASSDVHTSIDRAIWVAGIGEDNLVRVPIMSPRRQMDPQALRNTIEADLAAGHLPAGIIACTGGTGTGASDDIAAIVAVAREYDLYLHVDAAWAGTAMICEDFRWLWAGIEGADSLVFNPHKWLGAQFDCAAHFVRDPGLLTRTLAIRPSYLETHGADGIINYSEWSIPLGRRFRALKLWFLIRAEGMEGLRARIRNHVAWTASVHDRLAAHPDFEIVTDPILALFTFRWRPEGRDPDAANLALITRINDDGHIYLTQTRVDGAFVIRFTGGQFMAEEADFMAAADTIIQTAQALKET